MNKTYNLQSLQNYLSDNCFEASLEVIEREVSTFTQNFDSISQDLADIILELFQEKSQTALTITSNEVPELTQPTPKVLSGTSESSAIATVNTSTDLASTQELVSPLETKFTGITVNGRDLTVDQLTVLISGFEAKNDELEIALSNLNDTEKIYYDLGQSLAQAQYDRILAEYKTAHSELMPLVQSHIEARNTAITEMFKAKRQEGLERIEAMPEGVQKKIQDFRTLLLQQ